MKSTANTTAQRVWSPLSARLDRVLELLRAAETLGQDDVAQIAGRVAVEADRLAKEQPRTSRVSRADLEEHARGLITREVSERIRSAAPSLSRDLKRELEALKSLAAGQRRAARVPRRPAIRIEESEKYASGLPEARAIRLELEIQNARLELAGYSAAELHEVLRDELSDDVHRFVAETALAREITRPVVYDLPHGLPPESVVKEKAKVDQSRAEAAAALLAVRDSRVPESVRKREAAVDAVLAAIDARAAKVTSLLVEVRSMGVPMPAAGQSGAALLEQSTALHSALIEAVQAETIAEVKAPTEP